MKTKYAFLFLLAFISTISFANLKAPITIDFLDSVFLDFDKYTLVGNDVIEIPVFIESDDQINALDLSIKLDTTNIKYVTVIDYTGHIQFADFFNPIDSKLRFTSNSFKNYPVGNSKVIAFRFKLLNNAFKKEYLTTFNTFLNGDTSSNKLKGKDYLKTSINDFNNFSIKIYPTLINNEINVLTQFKCQCQLIGLHGQALSPVFDINKDFPLQIFLNNSVKGLFFISVWNENHKHTYKLFKY